MTDFSWFLDHLDNAKEYSGYICATCPNPNHDDKNPSFFVFPDGGWCKSCGWGKNSLEALKKSLEWKSVPLSQPKFSQNPWSRWLRTNNLLAVTQIAQRLQKSRPVQYLYERGFTNTVIEKYYLGHLDGWIIIPFISEDNTALSGATARSFMGQNVRYMNPYNQDPHIIYVPDWELFNEQNVVYLTFGIFDAISIAQCGKASMSTTTGKQIDPQALDFVRKTLIVVPDHGEEKAGLQLVKNLGWRGKMLRLEYNYTQKDPNDLLKSGGLKQQLIY